MYPFSTIKHNNATILKNYLYIDQIPIMAYWQIRFNKCMAYLVYFRYGNRARFQVYGRTIYHDSSPSARYPMMLFLHSLYMAIILL